MSSKAKKYEQLKRRKLRHKEFIRQLRSNPCEECGGIFHFSAMKFVGHTESISKMALYSKERILQEVKNCKLICSNCMNYSMWKKSTRSTQIPHFMRGKIYIESLKTGKPCLDCGEYFHFSIMEFDHRPGTIKKRNISKMNGYSKTNIDSEAAKCDLVCSNCHHIRTWKRLAN